MNAADALSVSLLMHSDEEGKFRTYLTMEIKFIKCYMTIFFHTIENMRDYEGRRTIIAKDRNLTQFHNPN